jgi:hypothetical protein
MKRDAATLPTSEADWQSVADELAEALRQTMLRNPFLTAPGWDRARAALSRYEEANAAS